MDAIRVHVWISGRVQGVGYRFSTQMQAVDLALAGWVRNLPDGRVEAVLEGSPAAVQSMVSWCWQGPTGAMVRQVEVREEVPEGLRQFEIRR